MLTLIASLQLQLAKATLTLLTIQMALASGMTTANVPAIVQNRPLETAFTQSGEFSIPTEKDRIKGKIRYFSSIWGVDENLAIRIADCESNLYRFAKNPSSTAKSYFQFLDGTWKNTMIRMGLTINSDVFNEDIQINAGTWLLKKDGTRHWLESKTCWS